MHSIYPLGLLRTNSMQLKGQGEQTQIRSSCSLLSYEQQRSLALTLEYCTFCQNPLKCDRLTCYLASRIKSQTSGSYCQISPLCLLWKLWCKLLFFILFYFFAVSYLCKMEVIILYKAVNEFTTDSACRVRSTPCAT